MRVLSIALCLGLAGCMMQGEGPAKKLTETVQSMNKATRWGQLGEAGRLVEPLYRARFLQTHAHWGASIQVADSEIVHMEMSPDGSKLYTANGLTNDVTIIDVATLKAEKSVPVGRLPWGIAIKP